MNPMNIVTLNEVMTTFVTAEPGKRLSVEHDLNGDMGLVVIKFTELAKAGKCNIEELLHRENAHSKTLGILGMNHIGQAIAHQARLDFGMEIFYHHSHPVPEVETACAARFFPLDDVLQQADFICVVLPLTRETEKLIGTRELTLMHPQTIFLAWRRSPPIERAIAHVSKHYAERIHLDNLATVAELSKFHLVRLFSATLGITPHRYQLLLRVSHAKTMLRRGDKIGEVAFRVGFSDQSHFNRCFRAIVGMTPGRYQKNGAV